MRTLRAQLTFPYLRLLVCRETAPSENTAWTSAWLVMKEQTLCHRLCPWFPLHPHVCVHQARLQL